jgi:predicted transcriptional regulator
VTRKGQAVTDAELAVLKILWQRGPLTAKAITAAIYPEGAESEFASVASGSAELGR